MLKTINSDNLPTPLGPYCYAIKAGGFIFASGQVGKDPKTDKLLDGIENQTKQTLENLKEVLKAAGCEFNQVVKVTIYLKDVKDYKVMNEVYATYFSDHKPARSTTQAGDLPGGALVEMDVIAIDKNGCCCDCDDEHGHCKCDEDGNCKCDDEGEHHDHGHGGDSCCC